jgi:hypothetical protein
MATDGRSSEHLPALAAKIARILAVKPECFITHRAELQVLQTMNRQELHAFAEERGWRSVYRVGGRQIEFYHDAGARLEAS